VAFIFIGVVLLQPTLVALASQGKLLAGVTTILLSTGIYVFVLRILTWLFGRWQFLRKLVLGRSFLEGTWVGHYVKDGKDLFTIERIDQASGATVTSASAPADRPTIPPRLTAPANSRTTSLGGTHADGIARSG
jgi:hypothetical protein